MQLKHLPGLIIVLAWTSLIGLALGLIGLIVLPVAFPWMAFKDTRRERIKYAGWMWFIHWMKWKYF